MKFEWDELKNQRNQKKHDVAFEEAQTIFNDPFYIDFYDPEHSDDSIAILSSVIHSNSVY